MIKFFVPFIYVPVLSCLFVCISCAFSANRGQKRVLDPIELQLQAVLSCYESWELKLSPPEKVISALKPESSLQLQECYFNRKHEYQTSNSPVHKHSINKHSHINKM